MKRGLWIARCVRFTLSVYAWLEMAGAANDVLIFLRMLERRKKAKCLETAVSVRNFAIFILTFLSAAGMCVSMPSVPSVNVRMKGLLEIANYKRELSVMFENIRKEKSKNHIRR